MLPRADVAGGIDAVTEPLEWAYTKELAESELEDEMKYTASSMEDAINDHMNMIRCCMARLTALHLASA
jgi:hypothetical protein